MEIVFDPIKRDINKAKHGFDFADLDMAFFDAATIYEGKEDRLVAVGLFGGAAVVVVFRPLGTEALSVISMRLASRKERKWL